MADRSDDAAQGAGQGEGLESLFLALERPLLCYALRLVKNPDMAQDIVQEAFLRLHAQPGTVREPRGWLYRTVHNLGLNHLRAATRLVSTTADSRSDPGVEEIADLHSLPDEQLARWEGIGLVRLGLANLDERSRTVVHLKFQENLSYREISAATGLTVGHVGYLLHHALKSLADDLARAGLLS
jgi:RNA polymerase sigma-70 factor (ECF subfamily)